MSTSSSSSSAFECLDRKVQEAIWHLEWEQLRPLQIDAIHAVIEGDKHLILSAATASGKTEAAFLPILSKLTEPRDSPSVRAIYVSPLKALINDQFNRLEKLCQFAEIPVHKWHGDVGATAKKKFRKNPEGVLLITPESLESNFINYGNQLHRLYSGLEFVVIDELHAFLDGVRGMHLRSLLARIQAAAQVSPRLIGLSATLSDDKDCARRFLSPDAPETVEIIEDSEGSRAIKIALRHYLEREKTPGESIPPVMDKVARDLARVFRQHSNLIFTNSRKLAEVLADKLHRIAKREGWDHDPFFVHHGSLSREIREEVETLLKEQKEDSNRPITSLCTSTLEMGIDIGSIHSVGQIGPPWTVNSLVQRLGRSGRKGSDPSILRGYVVDDRPGPDSSVEDNLFPNLLRFVALIELLLEKWLEPPEDEQLHLSTCIHQVLSILRQTGGIHADKMFQQLCVDGPFRGLSSRDFAMQLRGLAGHEVIEQMATGEIILAPKGEYTVEDWHFYAAFTTTEEFSVRHGDVEIGTQPVDAIPPEGQHLILAGRRWLVDLIDGQRKRIQVLPAKGAAPPEFVGVGGGIHNRVVEKMREILAGNDECIYLSDSAKKSLEEARQFFRKKQLHERNTLPVSGGILWLPWVGTRAMTTIIVAAGLEGIKIEAGTIGLLFEGADEEILGKFLQKLATGSFDSMTLSENLPTQEFDRFDEWADPGLLARANQRRCLDEKTAINAARKCLSSL